VTDINPAAIPFIGRTSLLEAVNSMLRAAGSIPTTTLTGVGALPDTEAAYTKLQEVNRDVQSMGWHFNEDRNLRILADSDGYRSLPADTLVARIPGRRMPIYVQGWDSAQPFAYEQFIPSPFSYGGTDLTIREGKLYDVQNQTFNIQGDVYVDVVHLIPFEWLPQYARTYITAKATRVWTDTKLLSDTAHKIHLDNEQNAFVTFQQGENEDRSPNMKDSAWTMRMLRR